MPSTTEPAPQAVNAAPRSTSTMPWALKPTGAPSGQGSTPTLSQTIPRRRVRAGWPNVQAGSMDAPYAYPPTQ